MGFLFSGIRRPQPGERGRYEVANSPRSHANPARVTRLPILSLHVRNGRIASPDDCQAEMQFVLLQERRVVTAVRVPPQMQNPRQGCSTREALPNQASSRRWNI